MELARAGRYSLRALRGYTIGAGASGSLRETTGFTILDARDCWREVWADDPGNRPGVDGLERGLERRRERAYAMLARLEEAG